MQLSTGPRQKARRQAWELGAVRRWELWVQKGNHQAWGTIKRQKGIPSCMRLFHPVCAYACVRACRLMWVDMGARVLVGVGVVGVLRQGPVPRS
jgi:hypothetical protein